MQKISIKNIVLVFLLVLILVGLIYINGQVFIQGGSSVLALEQKQIQDKLSQEVNEEIIFIDRYALDEVFYVFQGTNDFYYVNAEATIISKFNRNLFVIEEWQALMKAFGVEDATLKHGFYKEPIIALVNKSEELVFSLETKLLLFRHER